VEELLRVDHIHRNLERWNDEESYIVQYHDTARMHDCIAGEWAIPGL